MKYERKDATPTLPTPGTDCGWGLDGGYRLGAFNRNTTSTVLDLAYRVRALRLPPSDCAELMGEPAPAFPCRSQWLTLTAFTDWPRAWESTSAEASVKSVARAALAREASKGGPVAPPGIGPDPEAIPEHGEAWEPLL